MLLDCVVGWGILEVGINDVEVLDCGFCALLAGGVGESRLSAGGWVQPFISLSEGMIFASCESGNVSVMLLGWALRLYQ